MTSSPAAEGPQPLLAITRVSKSFGAVAALRGVHPELHGGEDG